MKPKTQYSIMAIVVIFAVVAIGLASITMTAKWEKEAKAHKITKESVKTTKEQLKICQSNLASFQNLKEKTKLDILSYISNNFRRVPRIVGEAIAEHVVELSEKEGMAVPIIMGIMEVESNFNPTAVSKKYARGLMQVMWGVWNKVLTESLGLKDQYDLHRIDSGIHSGILVFKHYLSQNDNNISKALYYYVGKNKDYASKVYEAMGRFVLHTVSTLPEEVIDDV